MTGISGGEITKLYLNDVLKSIEVLCMLKTGNISEDIDSYFM